MGIIVDAGGLSSEISTATENLTKANEAIEQCKQQINAFCSDFSLSGSAYSNARQYFSAYVPMLDALSTQIEDITSGAATVTGVLGECPDLGYGDSDQIKRDIQQAERMKQYYEQKRITHIIPGLIF